MARLWRYETWSVDRGLGVEGWFVYIGHLASILGLEAPKGDGDLGSGNTADHGRVC
jgi:hypothetical protein